MKRFHVHLHVENLAKTLASIPSCSPRSRPASSRTTQSGCSTPPPVNFAISTHGAGQGVLALDSWGANALWLSGGIGLAAFGTLVVLRARPTAN